MRKQLTRKSVFIYVIILSCLFSGCQAQVSFNFNKYKPISDVNNSEQWTQVTSKEIVLENSTIRFSLDTASTHFGLTNKLTGKTYNSVFSDGNLSLSNEDTERANSELTLTYSDPQSRSLKMTSFASVKNNNFTILKNADKIRVGYTFGATKNKYFLPVVIPQKRYEEIKDSMQSTVDKRRLDLYYKLFTEEDKGTNDYNEAVKKYPQIASNKLYVLGDGVNLAAKEQITEYMEKAGYTEEKYLSDTKKLKIEADVQTPVGFYIPVEYEISSDGFTAEVLTSQIKEFNAGYKLQSILLLENFAAAGDTRDIKFFIPDGSGAVIDTKQNAGFTYSQKIYGKDYTKYMEKEDIQTQEINLPVFGAYEGNDGIFSIVEGAAAVSRLYVNTAGGANPFSKIYCEFNLRETESSNISQEAGESKINRYSRHFSYEYPKIRYAVINDERMGFVQFAQYYQNYLIDKGVLKADANKKINNLFLDFTCSVSSQEYILGMPYERNRILTMIPDVIGIAKQLKRENIGNVSIRLIGYNSGGIENTVFNKLSIIKGVGTVKDLNKLSGLMNNGKLYIDTNFSSVYKDKLFDGFSANANYSRRLDKTVASGVVSPKYYQKYAGEFLNSLDGTDKAVGLSWSRAGFYLGGDYEAKSEIDLNMASDMVAQTMKSITDKRGKMVTEGGFLYALPNVGTVLKLPYVSSDFDIETYAVPFYQMIVHGFIDYAGVPINQSNDAEKAMLRMIEYGGVPYYSLVTAEESVYRTGDVDLKTFSPNCKRWMKDIQVFTKRVKNMLDATQKKRMIGYETVQEGVSVTTYEGSAEVVVNYNKFDIQYKGVTVKPNDFVLLQSNAGVN